MLCVPNVIANEQFIIVDLQAARYERSDLTDKPNRIGHFCC
jgi:hypothetical protein